MPSRELFGAFPEVLSLSGSVLPMEYFPTKYSDTSRGVKTGRSGVCCGARRGFVVGPVGGILLQYLDGTTEPRRPWIGPRTDMVKASPSLTGWIKSPSQMNDGKRHAARNVAIGLLLLGKKCLGGVRGGEHPQCGGLRLR